MVGEDEENELLIDSDVMTIRRAVERVRTETLFVPLLNKNASVQNVARSVNAVIGVARISFLTKNLITFF